MNTSIMIVDDDDAIREMAEEFLKFTGYSTISTSSAEEAIEMLKLFQPDIILTDISMQGISGLELTRIVKQTHPVEVIVMTGYIAEHSYEEAIRAGASDFIFKPFRFEELHLRIKRVIREMNLKRQHDELIKKLEMLAITDGLTGLYNQRHFYQQLGSEIERTERYSTALCLLLLDIDYFKKFNDTWGHLEGDKVLMELGKMIKSCLRNMDSAYRYGGEEFTVILPETSIEKGCVVGERIRKVFESKSFFPARGKEIKSTISVGAAQLNQNESITSLIKRADMAMFKSKNNGRNRVTCDQ
ncbi:MAG: diguanylate cyclase [Desulfamplus sp.]|nr:diguanylate cyclase [Desulfamplus sp.]